MAGIIKTTLNAYKKNIKIARFKPAPLFIVGNISF